MVWPMIKPFDYVTAINTHKDIMTDTDNDALMAVYQQAHDAWRL